MKRTIRIVLIAVLFAVSLFAPYPQPVQAKAPKLSPGFYLGKFNFTVYSWVKSTVGDSADQLSVDYLTNVDIQGTLIFSVSKKGVIKPSVEIRPYLITTYDIYSVRLTNGDCNGTAYLGGEAKGSITQDTSTAFNASAPGFSATMNFGSFNPIYYKKWGSTTLCEGVLNEEVLIGSSNEMLTGLNNWKTIKFLVVHTGENFINGTIVIPNYDYSQGVSGGSAGIKEPEGFFLVYLTNPLAELDDGSLISPSEWRTK